LAKELGMSSKRLIEQLHAEGIMVSNHMATLDDDEADKIRAIIKNGGVEADDDEPKKKKKPAPKKVKKAAPASEEDDEEDEDTKGKKKSSKKKSSAGRLQKKERGKVNRRKVREEKHKQQELRKIEVEQGRLEVSEELTVGEFAEKIGKSPNELIRKLMNLGIMATINQDLDFDTMEILAADYEIELIKEVPEEVDLLAAMDYEDAPEELKKRAPIVTVMGHVDHGKTSLLDAIRETKITDTEAGGITQHIGASEIFLRGEKIVFLDTPGHEAFTSLRARGAKVTDVAILVVAADDGVMPQTIEAIDHAKAAGVPIIVAINKIDKANANPDRVKQELSEHNVLVEEWGGDTIAVPCSALKREGIDEILDMVLLVAEMQELKANPDRPGIGTVIESRVEKGRGTVATLLIEKGTVHTGDTIFAGVASGRVRAMYNHLGKEIKVAGPATPVEIIGLSDLPQAGDRFYITEDDKTARELAETFAAKRREENLHETNKITLEDLFSKMKEGKVKDLNIIIKADVHGSVEALKLSLLRLSNDEIKINILHANVGTVTESDISLAAASNAIIIGFNVSPNAVVRRLAEEEGVDLRTYRIIYNAIQDVEQAMTGMLEPEYKEVIQGQIEVRATFKVPNAGTIAGGYVQNGKVTRNSKIRLVRDGIIIFEGEIDSLKRFKDDVKEVNQGYECGIGIAGFNDLKEGDIIEAYDFEEIKRTL
jgi:translation initiation factor IF-2